MARTQALTSETKVVREQHIHRKHSMRVENGFATSTTATTKESTAPVKIMIETVKIGEQPVKMGDL